MDEKNKKNQLLTLLDIFQDILTLENQDGTHIRDIEETVKRAKSIGGIISDETYKEFIDVFIPGLSSPFGKEMAHHKCKMVLRNINVNLISTMKKAIEDMVAKSKEIKNKNIILDHLYNLMGRYKDEVNLIKSSITSFEGKNDFLKACQSAASNNYRGLLYFGHSTISLGKVLSKILGSVFDKEGPTHGKTYIDKTNIKERLGLIQYYIDREVMEKTTIERLEEFFFQEINASNQALAELTKFPKLPGRSLDEMVEFMMKAYDSKKDEYIASNDDPQGNAVVWMELANNMPLALEIGINFFNEIKPRLGMIGNNGYQNLVNVLERIEESYKINDKDETLKYIELFKFGIVGEMAVFYMDLYDITSFITSSEYLLFTFMLIYIMFETYRKTYKKENITGE